MGSPLHLLRHVPLMVVVENEAESVLAEVAAPVSEVRPRPDELQLVPNLNRPTVLPDRSWVDRRTPRQWSTPERCSLPSPESPKDLLHCALILQKVCLANPRSWSNRLRTEELKSLLEPAANVGRMVPACPPENNRPFPARDLDWSPSLFPPGDRQHLHRLHLRLHPKTLWPLLCLGTPPWIHLLVDKLDNIPLLFAPPPKRRIPPLTTELEGWWPWQHPPGQPALQWPLLWEAQLLQMTWPWPPGACQVSLSLSPCCKRMRYAPIVEISRTGCGSPNGCNVGAVVRSPASLFQPRSTKDDIDGISEGDPNWSPIRMLSFKPKWSHHPSLESSTNASLRAPLGVVASELSSQATQKLQW